MPMVTRSIRLPYLASSPSLLMSRSLLTRSPRRRGSGSQIGRSVGRSRSFARRRGWKKLVVASKIGTFFFFAEASRSFSPNLLHRSMTRDSRSSFVTRLDRVSYGYDRYVPLASASKRLHGRDGSHSRSPNRGSRRSYPRSRSPKRCRCEDRRCHSPDCHRRSELRSRSPGPRRRHDSYTPYSDTPGSDSRRYRTRSCSPRRYCEESDSRSSRTGRYHSERSWYPSPRREDRQSTVHPQADKPGLANFFQNTFRSVEVAPTTDLGGGDANYGSQSKTVGSGSYDPQAQARNRKKLKKYVFRGFLRVLLIILLLLSDGLEAMLNRVVNRVNSMAPGTTGNT